MYYYKQVKKRFTRRKQHPYVIMMYTVCKGCRDRDTIYFFHTVDGVYLGEDMSDINTTNT